MITDTQYIAWLTDPKAIRIVLIEPTASVAGVETTFYLTTGNYVTGAGDSPPNQFYLPMAVTNVAVNESLSLTNAASMTVGDVEVHNYNGDRDAWLSYVWVNRPIKAFVGDPRWARSDFRPIFDGTIEDIGSRARDKLNLKIKDKLQRLNNAVTETKLGGTSSNKDSLIPVGLGELSNVTPLLVDASTLQFQFADSAIFFADTDAVRDNGAPVSTVMTAATGKFKLGQAQAGAITVSYQADSTANSTLSKLVQKLVTSYGKSTDRFTSADLDAVSLAAFDSSHTQPLGLYLAERTNVINACQQLAASLGAQLTMTRLGLLRLYQLDFTGLVSTFTIKNHQMLGQELSIASRSEVAASVKLGFNKNWTTQDNLLTNLPAASKDALAKPWSTETYVDTPTQALYKLSADPVQEDTLLLRRTDAHAECVRRTNVRKVTRTVYQFTGFSEMLQLSLGQAVTIFHSRFNLAAGGLGIVVSLQVNWSSNRVVVGVMI